MFTKHSKFSIWGGPRQAGKTTLLRHLASKLKVNYISLDDVGIREAAKEDPDLFLQKYPPPLLIDEAQYVPELFPYLKLRVDEAQKNGQYWLTGSQQFVLMKNLQESLAGRVALLRLLGLSFGEINKIPKEKKVFSPDRIYRHKRTNNVKSLFRSIVQGGFPALIARRPSPSFQTFYNSYIQTYIDRDLREIFGVTKISEFHKFLQLCAARTGQILNYSELAKDAGISVHAAYEWISMLESTMQIYFLRPYFRNISKRLIKAPKLYFLDTGLAAFLTKWISPEVLMNGAMAGPFFETYVVSEIIKSYLYRGVEPPLYYFRDKEGHEVDLLIDYNGTIFPIEIKLAAKVTRSDCKNIYYLKKKLPNIGKAAIIGVPRQPRPIDRLIDFLHVQTIT